jgi:hypothetical protein
MAAVEHLRTYYFVINVLMGQQLLNGADVLAPFQQMCCLTSPKASMAEPLGVAEAVAAGLFGQPDYGYGVGDQQSARASLQVAVMQAANPQQLLLQCRYCSSLVKQLLGAAQPASPIIKYSARNTTQIGWPDQPLARLKAKARSLTNPILRTSAPAVHHKPG